MLHTVKLQTERHEQMVDITHQIESLITQEQVQDGIALIYCPHTTAAITINENADPYVVHDIMMRLEEMYPWNHPRDRHGEGNSAAHLKASTLGASELIPITAGRLALGTWQGVYFCEFDGPRQRTFYVKVLSC
ncbi:MAG: secondary thiamine-phosphate synthase enzyme YjbQ [Syntrophomonadaceae bacterium]|nr:secondary thiamine-phosphate synthase enzyme YjbQ [Syntrophomonadaceae bacterium]